jgi:hypothetical protein
VTARPPAIGDERGSVGTGTNKRVHQERPTSTGFCIGDVWIVAVGLVDAAARHRIGSKRQANEKL